MTYRNFLTCPFFTFIKKTYQSNRSACLEKPFVGMIKFLIRLTSLLNCSIVVKPYNDKFYLNNHFVNTKIEQNQI